MSDRIETTDDEVLIDGAVGVLARVAVAATDALIVDVRKRAARRESGRVVAGAPYRDPEEFQVYDEIWRRSGSVLVYCVHGHEVSQEICAQLRAAGVDAKFIVGGFEALTHAGAALSDLGVDRDLGENA
ncbi:MAG: hypothetical protein AAF661_09060 [Pseudomonadota bacterium]